MRPKLTGVEINRAYNGLFADNIVFPVRFNDDLYDVEFTYSVDDSIANALQGMLSTIVPDKVFEDFIKHCLFGMRILPRHKKVIFNDPATVVIWEDGSKTVTKCKDEEFSTVKGVLMCAFRKVTRNRRRMDDFEDVLTMLSNIDADGMRMLADTLNVAADALEAPCDSR